MLKKKKAEPKSQHEFVSARKWSTRTNAQTLTKKKWTGALESPSFRFYVVTHLGSRLVYNSLGVN